MIYLVISFSLLASTIAGPCTTSICGMNQVCVNDTCTCKDSYILHKNDKDCIDTSCDVDDCVQCQNQKCRRCVHYINKETRKCSDTCKGNADVAYDGDLIGNICSDNSDKMDIIIGVVAGISAAVLLVFVSGIFLCFKVRQRRRHVNLRNCPSGTGKNQMIMDYGRVKRMPIFDNVGFEPDVSDADKDNFRGQVEGMRVHTDMLHLILYETRMKLRTMDNDDPRISTYKGVIHQLCRVLVMLNKKDPCLSIPADGLSLIGWATQMLEDYAECHDNTTGTSYENIRYSKFPTMALDADGLIGALYAIPGDVASKNRNHQTPKYHIQHISAKMPGYYSSVPVPFIDDRPTKTIGDNRHSSDCSVPQSSSVNYRPSGSTDPYSRVSPYSECSQPELSTFAGGLPWLAAQSLSQCSDVTDSSFYADGLPFSIEEATDPIEV